MSKRAEHTGFGAWLFEGRFEHGLKNETGTILGGCHIYRKQAFGFALKHLL
jgi:hypothetical protein